MSILQPEPPTRGFPVRHPGWTLLLATLVVAAAACGLPRLELRTDGKALVAPSDAAARHDAALRERFGLGQPVIVVVRPDTGSVYTPEILRLLSALTDDLTSHPGTAPLDVTSLATERGVRFVPQSLKRRPILDPLPRTLAEADSVRREVESIGLFSGTLVATNGSAAAIRVELPDTDDRVGALARIQEVVASHRVAGVRVDLLGAAAAEAWLGRTLLRDLGVPAQWIRLLPEPPPADAGALARLRAALTARVGLLPLLLAVVVLVFLAGFGSWRAVGVALTEALAVLVFVFGLMGWFGVPVYLTTAVLPVILLAVSLTDEVHLLDRFRTLRDTETPRDAAARAILELRRPLIQTSVTTALGFLSFALSPLPPVRAFGLFTACGMLFCLAWSLWVVPALLQVAPPPPGGRGFVARMRRGIPTPPRLATPVLLTGCAVLALSIPFGVARIQVQDSWVDGFAPASAFRRAVDAYHRAFFGSHTLLVELTDTGIDSAWTVPGRSLQQAAVSLPALSLPDSALAGVSVTLLPPDSTFHPPFWEGVVAEASTRADSVHLSFPLRYGSARFAWRPPDDAPIEVRLTSRAFERPEALRRVQAFTNALASREDLTVGGALGPADFLTTTRYITLGERPEARTLPESSRDIAHLWNNYGIVRGANRRSETVSDDRRTALVTLFLKGANYRDTATLLEVVETERQRWIPDLEVRLGGDVAVSQSLIRGIIDTQMRSVLASLIAILLVSAWFLRSGRWGIVVFLPALLGVGATLGSLGWFGIPLGVATSMFAAMTLGLGVDFAVHLVFEARRARALGAAPQEAVDAAWRTATPAILLAASTMVLGLSVLLLSEVPANARLGALAVAGIVVSAGASLLLLPAILRRLLRT